LNTNKSSYEVLAKKKVFKAAMENFELQGKADFFGRINRISKAMKEEERERKQIFEGKNHKEIIAKKKKKKQEKKRIKYEGR